MAYAGLGPYNFVGVSAGQMLSSLKSIDDVFTWNVLFTISAIAIIVGCPTYLMKTLGKKYKIKTS